MSQRSGVCGICQVYHSNLQRHFQECHALKNYVLECRYCFHHEVRGDTMKLHLKKQHPDEDWPLDLLLLQRSCPSFRYLGHCPKCPFKAPMRSTSRLTWPRSTSHPYDLRGPSRLHRRQTDQRSAKLRHRRPRQPPYRLCWVRPRCQ